MATVSSHFRDWIGRLMRRVGLHRLSGWWDAGTDHRAMRRAERDRLSGYDRKTGMYLKGGLRARNAPEPTGHPRVSPALTDTERIDKLRRALAAAGSQISGLQDGDYMAPPPAWIEEVLDQTKPAREQGDYDERNA